jgi:predicted transport protein
VITLWTCPTCGRSFRRKSQRHACGVGSRAALLHGKSPDLVTLYQSLEAELQRLGKVEIVTRDRYALFRTTRIFADLVFMRDGLRLAIHLDREVHLPCFFKVQQGSSRQVTHVAMLRTPADLGTIAPSLEEAYRLAAREESLARRTGGPRSTA